MNGSTSTERYIPMTTVKSGQGKEVAPDIYSFTIQFVNVCFVGTPGQEEGWVLIDAGTPKSAPKIIEEAKERFGEHAKPRAIVLTHAHFDHIGAIMELIEEWDVPIYAHTLELPYLTGEKNYPIPDSSVDAGLIAKLSPMFPTEAIDLGSRIQALPDDGSIPFMKGWRWIHTPGHTEGHISLFRDIDRALIVGDAFVTVKQESLYSVLTQQLDIHGPPKYLTPDWVSSWESVKLLEKLKPLLAITGHGHPVSGEWLANNLAILARDFDKMAIPKHGKYLNN
ncbi:MBL fold metallo-hydrolase [Paenisporosarcina sp. TG-14]|uniref:MBL fold metallo-hydrolase n=1 Tax=Paenisporosarcina sp. TG-14 TaxID=1231057 RepID=UPI000304BFD9|nr:MBL fold metallo-hydrolase [Paenisporosarcina sp. TG-14]